MQDLSTIKDFVNGINQNPNAVIEVDYSTSGVGQGLFVANESLTIKITPQASGATPSDEEV
jgi:hypothetical protein